MQAPDPRRRPTRLSKGSEHTAWAYGTRNTEPPAMQPSDAKLKRFDPQEPARVVTGLAIWVARFTAPTRTPSRISSFTPLILREMRMFASKHPSSTGVRDVLANSNGCAMAAARTWQSYSAMVDS